MDSFCQIWLTCANSKEADKIGRVLLGKRLVACVKKMPVSAEYWWQGKIEQVDEILLVMESRQELFEQIEAEVAKLHSYDTFVLESMPISKVSAKTANWLRDELNEK